ncbi:phosphoribosylamine--glycine ligase [bacterium]|nr:phosphoribosylamine--glycine ligase [bacterium]
MNVLILGSGAREHALAWKLKEQRECHKIWLHPGNAGARLSGFSDLGACSSLDELVSAASHNSVDLVVIGPEQMLEQGFADAFRSSGILVVGPSRESARLETSKIFAKTFMLEAGIPTAPSQIFESFNELVHYENTSWPWVLKLDGLAAGKGVVIVHSKKQVQDFAEAVWVTKQFGPGPHRILAEGFISGREVSYIGFCDGEGFIPLASATDHKRVLDGNQGPNTGGMGAISPSPHLTPELESQIEKRIILPFLRQLKTTSLDFRGILFVGLMIDPQGNPSVLEFNTRFGDPETQCVLPRLQSSLLFLLRATAKKRLNTLENPKWDSNTSVYVVACSQGYPEAPKVGDLISGLDSIPKDAFLFFSGVEQTPAGLVSHGGRVLGVGALDSNPDAARKRAYHALSSIHWRGIHFRTDIGL